MSDICVPDPEGHIRFGGDCTCGAVYCYNGVPEPGQFDPFCPDHGDGGSQPRRDIGKRA